MVNRNKEVEIRNELLPEILDCIPGNPIFDKVFDFYKNIFLQKPDLIVCMSRKAWCVIHLFLPLLENEGIVIDRKKLTHDRMVHPWFAELDQTKRSQIKVFVIDDSFQTGRALDECVRRLKWVYNIDENNITVAAFAMVDDKHNYNRQRIDTEKNLYTVYRSPARGKPEFRVNWGGGDSFSKEDVLAFSYSFVNALHACSEPYVGYIPAFRLPIEVVQDFLGAERGKDAYIKLNNESSVPIPGYLEQDDLRAPLNDPMIVGYYNITSQQMRQHDVEAFYISLPALDSGNKNYLPFLPSKDALSIAALRFYLNRKTGIALIVPYLSLKDCSADADIVKMFPEKLQPLMKKMCSEQVWYENEGHLTAYRLLRYASGYLWGKYVFKQWFGLDVKEENIASFGGICSDTFFDWLDSSSAEQDLTHIWSFFAPEMNNVVEETRSLEPDNETSLEDIIRRDMQEDGNNFINIIGQSLSVPDPVDYFSTASMMFRRIFTREIEMLNEDADVNKEARSLALPFHGFPRDTFFALFLLKFPELKTRRDVLTTVMFMLCDRGEAVTQLRQRINSSGENVIGTVLTNGEQSCHALAPIAPEYAHFLSELPKMLHKFGKEQRQKKFEMAKSEVRKYFEDELKQGMGRRLSLGELIAPLEEIRTIVVDGLGREFDAYPVLPRSFFFDRSELFFLELCEKLIDEKLIV